MIGRLVIVIAAAGVVLQAAQKKTGQSAVSDWSAVLNRYCSNCHNPHLKSGGLSFESMDLSNVSADAAEWEKVVTKLRAGMMPPAGIPRPEESVYDSLRSFIQTELDGAAAAHPNPGRTEVFHRLNRDEYQNAIHDLLAVDIDVSTLLPADDSSHGFDNMAGSLRLSESLMERYLSSGRTISRMAVGSPPPAVESRSYRVPSELHQTDRLEGLPFGTRGGTLIAHWFPRDAEYEIKVEVGGLAKSPNQIVFLLDGEPLKQLTIGAKAPQGAGATERPSGRYEAGGGKPTIRVPVKAGPHEIGVTFDAKALDLVEQIRQPFQNPHEGGVYGSMPTIDNVTIAGPYTDRGPGDTPSRRKILVCRPASASEEEACAKEILTKLATRAYRGRVNDSQIAALLHFYRDGRKNSDFETGIELAIRRLLVSPEFLFRIEADPEPGAQSSGAVSTAAFNSPYVYRLDDLDLASRLSFFIWSSIPDDELLDAARQGKLKDPNVLELQVKRMLADSRSEALTKNFAGQWLQTRNLDMVQPATPFSLDFDESLRRSMRRETDLFFNAIMRENRPVAELLTANYTFVNDRLAEHYGIPNIQGPEFQRIELPADSPRRGLLGQGSILAITSHPTRTSPVLRGKWILANILGTPPPDPPPNIPPLEDKMTQGKVTTVRERMAAHRKNEPCRSCHSMIDPAGFALENFDPIGRWRNADESWNKLDTSGALPDGTKFDGVNGLRDALVRRPERFANTLTQKLLTYALGRGIEYYDMPAVRKIVADAAPDYKFQSVILEVVKSYPFLMRRTGGGPPSSPNNVAAKQVNQDKGEMIR